MPAVRRMIVRLMDLKIQNPVILMTESAWSSADEHLIHFATETGALFLDSKNAHLFAAWRPTFLTYKKQLGKIENSRAASEGL